MPYWEKCTRYPVGLSKLCTAMGLIKAGRHDAFISYASRDDAAHSNLIKGIRDDMSKKFEAYLRRGPDVKADFFLDQVGMPANGLPSEELKNHLGQTEFLFIFLSESYIASDFCGKELDWFREYCEGSREEALKRTFVVVLEEKAKRCHWRDFLEKPERPKYVEFFDDNGNPLKRFLQADDYRAVVSPAYEAKLDWIVQTMVERIQEREVVVETKTRADDDALLNVRLERLKKLEGKVTKSVLLRMEKDIAYRYIFGES